MIKNRGNSLLFLPRLLVFLQFAALFTIMFSGPLFAKSIPLMITQLFSLILGVWAVLIMRIGNFNIVPIPVKNGVFISKGPYQLIRHPMYTSLFLFVIPELIEGFSYLRLAAFLVLLVTLIIKLNYEEKKLLLKFKEYEEYMKKTKRIIPFVY